MAERYIGEKKVATITDSNSKTPGDVSIMVVEYEDGSQELFSSLMLNRIISETACDLTELQKKRLIPVVEQMLSLLRDWGVKFNDLPLMSMMMNESLDFNQKAALIKLWSAWGAKLQSPDDVDLITIDRVLRAQTIDDAIKNAGK